jgi:hypothetical protein
MAHYAFITDGIVTEVIKGIDETETIEGLDPETWYRNFRNQTCKRTSYNARIRGNYAGVGYSYLDDLDLFVSPKCHDEAILNAKTAKWDCDNEEHDIETLA